MDRVESPWRDIAVSSSEKLLVEARRLGLDDLQVRVLASKRRQPQAIDGAKWLLVNVMLPSLRGSRLRADRLSVLVSRTQVVTLHVGDLAPDMSEAIEHHIRTDKSPTGVLAVAMNVAVERYGPILDRIDDVIDKLEDVIMNKPSERQLQQLFKYKQLLVELRRIVLPTTGMLNSLSDRRYDVIAVKYVPYIRDSYDTSWRTHEIIDSMRDLLSSALDTYLSVVSNHLNEVMKRLTIVATIFMPLSFITGFGGMNFVQMPFKSDFAFMLLMCALIATPIYMLLYFARKKWM